MACLFIWLAGLLSFRIVEQKLRIGCNIYKCEIFYIFPVKKAKRLYSKMKKNKKTWMQMRTGLHVWRTINYVHRDVLGRSKKIAILKDDWLLFTSIGMRTFKISLAALICVGGVGVHFGKHILFVEHPVDSTNDNTEYESFNQKSLLHTFGLYP